ncbi:MAG: hypothetical protein IPQ09_09730 [Myxococcales bacterium]|nr:hypothetical protein [Myxococcales bacterium]
MSKAAIVFGLALSCALAGSGCAGERPPIDQVQSGVLPKEFFVGKDLASVDDDPEFYFRTTVVDVAPGAGSESLFTASDAQPTVRIRWEVTQNLLVARLAYELVDATDGKGTVGPARNDEPRVGPPRRTNDGQIVASFAILKHFNIARSYNTSTGEENNVVVEDDVDQRWYERQYMRVDWSKNLVTDAYDLDGPSQIGLYGAVKWDPISYWVDDPKSPDAPELRLKDGYFDVTAKAFAAPQVIHDEEWGDFPACWLVGELPQTSCNPSEVKLRLAFKKVVDTDYEPADYDGKKMDMFGYFTNDRFGYDRRYGIVDDRWKRFASRWNIWQRSHDDAVACGTTATTPAGADVHRDVDGNGTEDECEKVGRGSRCDEFRHACTIPLRDRKVKTTVWHTNRGFPEDLFEGSKKVVETWSDTVRAGVLAARLVECRRTKEAGCEERLGWPATWSDDFTPPLGEGERQVPRVFVLCHNPVDPSKDDPACGTEPISPRVGDLRFNLFSLVDSPQRQSPWGIMVDAEDPLTGEKIAGSVNQWRSVLDRASATLTDLVGLLNGEIAPTAFVKGQNVADWVKQNTRGAPLPGGMSAAEVASRHEAFDPKVMAPFVTGKPGASRLLPPTLRRKNRMRELSQSGRMGAGDAVIADRLAKLRGSSLEAQIVTPEMAQLAGQDPRLPVTKELAAKASPLRALGTPAFRRAYEARKRVGRAHRHSCRREGPEADNLVGLAREAQRLFGTIDPADPEAARTKRDKVFAWARQKFSDSVFSHEFGHAVGLRHNFAGTFDSLNYGSEYWQLRTNNGTVKKTCADGNTDGEECIGPRWKDPLTQRETDGLINASASSSVMDYPGDHVQDFFIIGKYDRAAVRFGYGGTVDVWNAPSVTVTSSSPLAKRDAYRRTAFATSPGLFGVISFPEPNNANYRYIHYSEYAKEFGLLGECTPSPTAPLGATCTGAPLDVVDYRDMSDFVTDPDYPDFTRVERVTDPTGRVRRGYMFSSDEYSDSGNVPSFSYDSGADAYEQVRFLEQGYENRYILDAFRRNRVTFNSWDVVARTQSHYLDAIQNIAKTFGFAMVLETPDPTAPDKSLLADGNYGPLSLASTLAFDLFTRSLMRPEPGSYCSTGADDCYAIAPYGVRKDIFMADSAPTKDTKYPFALPLGQGRYIHNDFDYGQGYWWSDYQTQVGSFYDKTWALYYLSEAFDTFISNSKEDFVDGRYKNVNFATLYPTQVQRLMGAVLTGDVESMAPWVDGSNALVYPPWRNLGSLGTRPASARVVDPAFGWSQQLYAMVWGTMLFPTSWSQAFLDDSRIVSRAGETVTWPVGETYTFINPATGLTYRAHTTGTERDFELDHQKSIGARMLEWANRLVTIAYLVEREANGSVRMNADGTPKLLLAGGKPQLDPENPGADATLKRYVTNIEVMRQLTSTYVMPLESSLPDP